MKLRKHLAYLMISFMSVQGISGVTYAKEGAEYTLWSASNLEKITRHQVPLADRAAAVTFKCAQNEFEGTQLILTAKEAMRLEDVRFSDLTQSKGGETYRLGKEQIAIYLQHYMNVTEPTTKAFEKGWYPDALIPFEAAKSADIEGSILIPRGYNQGLWFTIKVPKGTPAGKYTGEVTLVIDGKEESLPVALEVWDFELTDESHSETAFAIWPHMLKAGHPDLIENTAAHEQLYQNYYEFFLDYRITPTDLPFFTTDPEEFTEKAAEFLKDPRITAFNIPHEATNYQVDYKHLEQMIDSLESAGVLDKGYCYFGGILDERNPNAESDYELVKTNCEALRKINPDIRNIITLTTYPNTVEKFGPLTNALTPVLTHFKTEQFVADLEMWKQKEGNRPWWYTCVEPKNPLPTYHMDDHLAGARILSWMQKAYDVDGNLYWCTNIFQKYDGQKYIARKIWEDPKAFPGANGDGFLVYPGYDYGINGPIGSIRLEAIREGNEDYEYLYTLEEALKTFKNETGWEVQLETYLDSLYDELFKGVVYTTDYEKVAYARETIAQQIQLLNQEAGGVAYMTAYEPQEGTGELMIAAKPGVSVKVNGEALTGVGEGDAVVYRKKIQFENGLNTCTVTFEKDGQTGTLVWQYEVEKEKTYEVEMNDFEEYDVAERLANDTLKVETTTNWATGGSSSLKVTYPVAESYPGLNLTPENGGLRHTDLSQFKTLAFDVKNISEEKARLVVKFYNEKETKDGVAIVELEPKTQQQVVIDLKALASQMDLTALTQITLWQCGNQPPVPQLGDVTLLLDHFYYTADKPYSKYPAYEVKKVEGNIQLDGQLKEPCWEMNYALKESQSYGGEVNNEARFGMVWDEKYLYVGFDVTDETIVSTEGNVWDDDSVEVFIDTQFQKGERQGADLKDYPQFTLRVKDEGIYVNGVRIEALEGVILQQSALTSGGYSFEIALPWERLGRTANVGEYIGLTIHVNDKDKPTGITDSVLGFTEHLTEDVNSAARWADFRLSAETMVIPEGEVGLVIEKGELIRAEELEAVVEIKPLGTLEQAVWVVFQLMDGETVVDLEVVEKTITEQQVIRTKFQVNQPFSESYTVRVFVLDTYDGALDVPETLAEKVVLK